MPSLDFPSNPTDQQTYTLNGITYQYNASIGAWLTVVVGSQPTALATDKQVLYSNNGLISGSNGLVFDNSANTLYANTINVSSNMRVYGNLQVGTGTVTITDNSIEAASIVVAGSAIPSGNAANLAYATANAGFAKANAALANASGTFAGDLSITGNVGIGTNFSSKFFEIRKDQNSETSLWITNNNSIAPGTNNSIIFGGYRDIDSNYQVAKISAIHGTGSSANANHSGALAFFTQQAIGLSNPDLPIERMRIDSAGRVTTPFQPRFHAKGLNTVTNNSNVVFPTAIFNVGGHYNTTNGRFTAPVTGYYMFGWTNIGAIPSDVYRWRFSVNGTTQGDVHLRQDTGATGNEYVTNAMFVIPWFLNAGDYANIFFASDGGNLPYGSGTATDDYPRFWGHLIG